MFNSKVINRIFLTLICIAICLVFYLLADTYQDKESRDILLYWCSFIACIAASVSVGLSFENSSERKELITAIKAATEEIQNLRIMIAKLGKTSAKQK